MPNTIKAKRFPVAEAGGMIWTRDEGDTAMPELPDTTPVATLAVDADAAAIEALCAAVEQWRAQVFAVDLDGVALTIGWHEPARGRTMLHASVANAADATRALGALRRLRARAEMRAAA